VASSRSLLFSSPPNFTPVLVVSALRVIQSASQRFCAWLYVCWCPPFSLPISVARRPQEGNHVRWRADEPLSRSTVARLIHPHSRNFPTHRLDTDQCRTQLESKPTACCLQEPTIRPRLIGVPMDHLLEWRAKDLHGYLDILVGRFLVNSRYATRTCEH